MSRSQEWRSAQFYLMKRTESRADLGYGLPRSAPWDESSKRSHKDNTVQGVFQSPGYQGRVHGTRGEEMATPDFSGAGFSLEPRACARAFGMGLDVESSSWVSGTSPWCLVPP